MTWTMSYSMASALQGTVDAGWPAKMTGISTMVIALSLLVVAVALVAALLLVARKLRTLSAQADTMVARVSGELGPVVHHLRSAADSAEQMATSLRADVQRISETVTTATDGVQAVLARSERRLKEMEALLRVIQHEAEEAIVSAAATVRGVRAVAAAFGEEAIDALSADDDADDDIDDADVDCDDEEIDNDDDTRHTAGGGEPRIRPRRGRRGRTGEL